MKDSVWGQGEEGITRLGAIYRNDLELPGGHCTMGEGWCTASSVPDPTCLASVPTCLDTHLMTVRGMYGALKR